MRWRIVKCINHDRCPAPWLAWETSDGGALDLHEFQTWRGAMRFVRRQFREVES